MSTNKIKEDKIYSLLKRNSIVLDEKTDNFYTNAAKTLILVAGVIFGVILFNL